MIQIDGLHTASEETCSREGESHEKRSTEEATDIEREITPNKIEQKTSRDMSGEDKDERRGRDSEDEEEPLDAASLAHKAMAAAHPFNPALFSPGQMQAFQNAVAQFTVSAAANNMDKETLMNNVAVLQTAFFTLQQQQILQFQLIQHLQSQLLKKSGEKTEDDEQEGELKDEDLLPKPPSPLRRLEEDSQTELDLSRKKSPSKEREKVPEPTTEPKHSPSSSEHKYQHNFSLASNIITEYDSPPSESNSLAMLEKKTQEVLNSASQGILANNLLDEIAFANDKDAANGRNDPFKHRCKFCGKIFGSDSSLQIHIRSHTGERPFKCNVCGSRFTTKGNLKVHFQRHTEKYPHIPMNPNPVPEHLDKYFPPLVPQEALKEVPPAPPNHMPNPFPPRVMFPDFFPRPPPFDLFGGPLELRKPVDLSREKKGSPPPPEDPPMSPEVVIDEGPKIKEEPLDETLDLSDKKMSPPPRSDPMDEDVPTKKEEREYNLRNSSGHSHVEVSKIPSVSPPSSSSSTSGSLYQDTVLDPAFYSAHLPRPDSNDSSWENFIEISSETSKLQELVDNIDNKTTEPNQCLVCKKVLSCRSALQMHYRVHTGERPFRCKICGRSFTTKGNLKTHMSVHRIKPPMRTLHQCPVCHQKFSNIFVLQQHIRLHTGEMTDLTPEQIRAAEIHDQPPRLHPFGRPHHDSDDDDAPPSPHKQSESIGITRENLRPRPRSPAPEDLRAMHTMHRLSVRSNEELSRDSSPISQGSDVKRMRSSSPLPSPPIHTRSPMTTPPAEVAVRPPFPYGPPFLGMPHVLPPFMNQAPFMRNVPLVPPSAAAAMPPFGLFGVRGNTTTCNICFKTFACNSALEIHYRSHTKERPFKCTICDRGFSTKGNMKQHMLTHKIRDMFGNSNSGDESRMSSTSQEQSTTPRPASKEGANSINFAIKLEKSQSPDLADGDAPTSGSSAKGNNAGGGSPRSGSPSYASDYSLNKDAEIKKWCNKLSEMPENIVAS